MYLENIECVFNDFICLWELFNTEGIRDLLRGGSFSLFVDFMCILGYIRISIINLLYTCEFELINLLLLLIV